MRALATSLGSWDTIETKHKHKHGITFPLAIVAAVMEAAGVSPPDVWEGDVQPEVGHRDVLLISAMDPRHFWAIPDWLRKVGVPVRAADRNDAHPIVVMGGQAATAPAPVEAFIDVVYIGEAEARFPEVLATLDASRGQPRARRLEAIAAIPGCLVPTHCPEGHVVDQVYADDIGVTLENRLWVNHRQIHRVEIARGCASKCGFCVLGWRSKYRENDASSIIESLTETARQGIREVHLSAGDAEGHSEIVRIREAVRAAGLRDHGWTGRLDTVRDCSVSAGKQFAFGLEGLSHRLRAAVGKRRLTDDYIADEIAAYWAAGGRRLMFHMIGGLPTETDEDAAEFGRLLERLRSLAGASQPMHLEVGRQPFGPMPHTPMQWFGPGLSTDRVGRAVARFSGDSALNILDKSGQTYRAALYHSLVVRGGREITSLVEAGMPALPSEPLAARARWEREVRRRGLSPARYLGEWDLGAPTPWDHVRSAYSRAQLEVAYTAIRRRLGLPG